MKHVTLSAFFILSFSAIAGNKTSKEEHPTTDQLATEALVPLTSDNIIKNENEFIDSAIKDGYQTQRNLAFGYQTGSSKYGGYDFIPKNMTKSCAWRKILLIANPEKTDRSDPANERYSCQKLNLKQDEEVWEIVDRYLPEIAKVKASGKYMIAKEDNSEPSGELQIIDVEPE